MDGADVYLGFKACCSMARYNALAFDAVAFHQTRSLISVCKAGFLAAVFGEDFLTSGRNGHGVGHCCHGEGLLDARLGNRECSVQNPEALCRVQCRLVIQKLVIHAVDGIVCHFVCYVPDVGEASAGIGDRNLQVSSRGRVRDDRVACPTVHAQGKTVKLLALIRRLQRHGGDGRLLRRNVFNDRDISVHRLNRVERSYVLPVVHHDCHGARIDCGGETLAALSGNRDLTGNMVTVHQTGNLVSVAEALSLTALRCINNLVLCGDGYGVAHCRDCQCLLGTRFRDGDCSVKHTEHAGGVQLVLAVKQCSVGISDVVVCYAVGIASDIREASTCVIDVHHQARTICCSDNGGLRTRVHNQRVSVKFFTFCGELQRHRRDCGFLGFITLGIDNLIISDFIVFNELAAGITIVHKLGDHLVFNHRFGCLPLGPLRCDACILIDQNRITRVNDPACTVCILQQYSAQIPRRSAIVCHACSGEGLHSEGPGAVVAVIGEIVHIHISAAVADRERFVR